MAKDDYFILAYRLLAYLYDCLRGRDVLELSRLRPGTREFPIDEAYFAYLLRRMAESGLIDGVEIAPIAGAAHGMPRISAGVEITPEGIAYLAENSMMQRVKAALQDVRGIIG